MNVFIGLDVSLASTAICVLGPQGKVVEELEAARGRLRLGAE